MIKSEEFQYKDIEKLKNLILRDNNDTRKILVKMEEIVEKMLALPVHYNKENALYSSEMEDCPETCKQPRICLRIRQTQQLIKDIMKKIGEKYPVFQDVQLIKIGFIDESDVALIMNKKYENYFYFNEKTQQLKAFLNKKLPEELAIFVDKENTFNCTKYFHVFLNEMYNVIKEKSVKLPEGLTLSVKYTPCDICRCKEDIVPQYVRCRHQPDCEEHKKTKDDPNYQELCDCKVYNLPSLSFSKIGIVLHLIFQEKDAPFIIDVDVNPPTIPSIKNVQDFNGSNRMKRFWLNKNRRTVRNWRAEWRNTHDMSAAGKVFKKTRDEKGQVQLTGNRSIRFRLVNKNLVIPEQVSHSINSIRGHLN